MQFEQPRNTEKPLDKQNRKLAFSFLYTKKSPYICPGEMAERSIAAVLKTVEVWASGGSNPSLSANNLLFIYFSFLRTWGVAPEGFPACSTQEGRESLSLRQQIIIQPTAGCIFYLTQFGQARLDKLG